MSGNTLGGKFNIFNLNIRSLRKHFDELCVYLNGLSLTYNIIVLTEVWIKSGEEDRYQIAGYDMILQPRTENQSGGVVIYVDSGLQHSHQLILCSTAEIIQIDFKVTFNNIYLDITLFGVYRNCKYTFREFKDEFINILEKTRDPTIIIGDMNICLMKDMGSAREYLDLISSFGFQSLVNVPTRIFNDTETCIDHLLFRNSKKLKYESNVIKLEITDHFALSLTFFGNSNTLNTLKFVKVLDQKLFCRQLNLADWNPVYNEIDVNKCVQNFYEIYNNCYNNACFLKKLNSKTRKRSEWISDYLIYLINRKNYMFERYNKDRSNLFLRSEYKTCAKTVAKQIKRQKLNYFSSLIDQCQGDSKKYWNVIKKIIKRKKRCLDSISIESRLVKVEENEKTVADAFNSYFTTIVSSLKHDAFGCDLFNDNDDYIYENLFGKFECTYDELVKAIEHIKNKPSCGIDGISIGTIKQNVNIFAPLLHSIFVKSLDQGIVPVEFKTASVVPIYKSGDQSLFSSYRPVSVISTVAKIFESMIKKQLLSYFHERSLFSDNQFGFLPGRGTDLAIEKHVNSIVSSTDKSLYTLAVYLDFQKAFDVLDIDILLYKFRKYGIGGTALAWLGSFCKGRRQVVKINKCYSDVLELQYGTAQGGVLGPIIFLIYINDLLNIDLHSSVFAYADDTALVCSAHNRQSLQYKINIDLEKISQWLIRNKLLINSSKSKCIMFFDNFESKENLTSMYKLFCHMHHCIYNCSCKSIEVVEFVRYLGVHIDQNLKWAQHINVLSKKLRKINYALYYLKGYLKEDQLKKMYLSWFESVLRYGIIHYGGTYPTILKPVVMNQRHALRIIYGIKKNDRLSYIFTEKNIFTFEQLHKYAIVLYIQKYLQNFEFKQQNRFTRSSQYVSISVPFLVKEISKHQFYSIGPTNYNRFIIFCGNEIIFEKKHKVKMKVLEFIHL